MINEYYTCAGTIKFFAGVDETKMRSIISTLKVECEEKFPGKWVVSHTRPAGDDGSFRWDFVRTSNGNWDGYDLVREDGNWDCRLPSFIIERLRQILSVDSHGRPKGVHNWCIGGDVKPV